MESALNTEARWRDAFASEAGRAADTEGRPPAQAPDLAIHTLPPSDETRGWGRGETPRPAAGEAWCWLRPRPEDVSEVRDALAACEAGYDGVLVELMPPEPIDAGALAALSDALPGRPIVIDSGYLAGGSMPSLPPGDHVHLGHDPLRALAAGLTTAADTEQACAAAAAHIAGAPRQRFVLRTHVYQQLGCPPHLELAIALASATAYFRAVEASGHTIDTSARWLRTELSVDGAVLISAAKLRAWRTVWGQWLEYAELPITSEALRVGAAVSPRRMNRVGAAENLLRLSAAVAAGHFGGADQILTESPGAACADWWRGIRIARNAQLVLREESGLNRVADPGGGSDYIEWQTQSLAQHAWAAFQEIEAMGGLPAALATSWWQDRRDEWAEAPERPMLGLSRYPAPETPAAPRPRPEALDMPRPGARFEALLSWPEVRGMQVAWCARAAPPESLVPALALAGVTLEQVPDGQATPGALIVVDGESDPRPGAVDLRSLGADAWTAATTLLAELDRQRTTESA